MDEHDEILEALQEAEQARPWLPAGALRAMAEEESGFQPRRADSRYTGLLRVPNAELTRFGLKPEDALDWRQNVRAGLTILDELQAKFDNPVLALTAYRAGSGKVADWQRGGARLKRSEIEFAPRVLARSTKYGGVATHGELLDVAKTMGVEDLGPIYKAAGLAGPKLPRGATVGDNAADDPHVLEMLEQPIGRLLERSESGRRKPGVDLVAKEAFEATPGAPSLRTEPAPSLRTEPAQSAHVPPQVAAALGMPDMSATLGPRVDRAIDALWGSL